MLTLTFVKGVGFDGKEPAGAGMAESVAAAKVSLIPDLDLVLLALTLLVLLQQPLIQLLLLLPLLTATVAAAKAADVVVGVFGEDHNAEKPGDIDDLSLDPSQVSLPCT